MQKNMRHASCVACGKRAVLILGPSGSGKSELALRLMAYGCTLVADDQTELWEQEGQLLARSPSEISGKIEARGVGILNADHADEAVVVLVVDLTRTEKDRLPVDRTTEILGCKLPSSHKSEIGYFPEAILQYLKAGRFA